MNASEIRRVTEKTQTAKRIAAMLYASAYKEEIAEGVIVAVDALAACAEALVVLVPSIADKLGEDACRGIALLAASLLLLTIAYIRFVSRGQASRKRDHAEDLLFHVDQLYEALESRQYFGFDERVRLSAQSVQHAIKQSTELWPVLLSEFLGS